MKAAYRKLKNGEPIIIDLGKTIMSDACCDCGAVHIWQFRHIKGNTWEISWVKNKRATGQLRRHNYGVLQQEGKLKIK
jgi:hypothetical protein